MDQISLAVQTLYAELLEQCLRTSGPTGSFYVREKAGISYTYLKSTVGQKRVDMYVGRSDTLETEGARKIIERANAAQSGRREIVRMLKHSLPAPLDKLSKIISALKWFGIMDRAVLVGTNAFVCYSALVGYRLDGAVMTTDDADIATLNLAVGSGLGNHSMNDALQLADDSFGAVPGFAKATYPSQFRSADGYRVDLLTQQRSSRSEAPVALPNLQAAAMPLQHMEWLITSPATAVLLSGSGILVSVPQPARYAVHKLIVAQKRNPTERLKRRKDLAQARSLLLALQKSDPGALYDAYVSACDQGKKGWEVPIKRSLRELDLEIEEI